MTHRTFHRRAWLGGLVIAIAGSLAAPADAANPHLVSADPTLNDPIFSPGSLSWDGSLNVPFKIAGLGNNPGLTVTLNSKLTLLLGVKGTSTLNSLTATFGFTSPSGLHLSVSAEATSPGEYSIAATLTKQDITLTSDKNGNVTGTLTIPGSVMGVIPDNLACVEVSWTLTTLTFSGKTVPLPDASRQFDSTGSFCSTLPPPFFDVVTP